MKNEWQVEHSDLFFSLNHSPVAKTRLIKFNTLLWFIFSRIINFDMKLHEKSDFLATTMLEAENLKTLILFRGLPSSGLLFSPLFY